MVNNPKLRRIAVKDVKTRKSAGGRTKVNNGPLYDLAAAQELIKTNGLRVVNLDAQNDQVNRFDPVLTDEELVKFIAALKDDHHIESELCKTSNSTEIHCDAYAMRWNRTFHREWEYGQKVYVKFGFSESDPTCMVVAIHPSKW